MIKQFLINKLQKKLSLSQIHYSVLKRYFLKNKFNTTKNDILCILSIKKYHTSVCLLFLVRLLNNDNTKISISILF